MRLSHFLFLSLKVSCHHVTLLSRLKVWSKCEIYCHQKPNIPIKFWASFLTWDFQIPLSLCVCVCVCVCARLDAQLCQTLCSAMDCSPPGASVHGIFQARILELVAISPSRGSSQSRDWTCVSCISSTGRRFLYHCATGVFANISLCSREI